MLINSYSFIGFFCNDCNDSFLCVGHPLLKRDAMKYTTDNKIMNKNKMEFSILLMNFKCIYTQYMYLVIG